MSHDIQHPTPASSSHDRLNFYNTYTHHTAPHHTTPQHNKQTYLVATVTACDYHFWRKESYNNKNETLLIKSMESFDSNLELINNPIIADESLRYFMTFQRVTHILIYVKMIYLVTRRNRLTHY